ncbi:MAG: 5-methyltetrahydropteroyltriglutamate--homocysteine S-methyltransferase [Atopobiaceae bacterium]
MSEPTKQPPYIYDIVGSFLRPAALKQARADFAAGKIDRDALTKVEDESIADLVQKEKNAGLRAVTDGEFRRAMWHLDFLSELEGVEEIDAKTWSVEFKGPKPKGAQLRFTGKVDFGNHPFLEHYRKVRQIAGDYPTKMTIPAPSMLHLIPCVRGKATYQPIERYQDEKVLLHDIAIAYQHAIKAFYDEGCRYLQFDDTSWGEFCDPTKRAAYEAQGIDLDAVEQSYVDVINLVLEAKPADMTITTHICRGNFRSTWFSSGGYEPVAKVLFGQANYDGFFLEYDSDRAGDFEPLREIRDQVVVLGLVTSKFPELEDEDAVIARINEASKYVPLDQLRLSTQCGFSSTEEGNVLTEDDQWAKIALVKRIAERVWGK